MTLRIFPSLPTVLAYVFLSRSKFISLTPRQPIMTEFYLTHDLTLSATGVGMKELILIGWLIEFSHKLM